METEWTQEMISTFILSGVLLIVIGLIAYTAGDKK